LLSMWRISLFHVHNLVCFTSPKTHKNGQRRANSLRSVPDGFVIYEWTFCFT
jgi:hypothetical protein